MKKKKTNNTLYLNLQRSLTKLLTLFSAPAVNTNKLAATLGDLRFARKQIEKKANRKARKLLIYCIDTLFEIIEEDNHEKIHDFTNLICDMPEIALGKRNFRSFQNDILTFNQKYGEYRFSDVNTIRIHLSRETIKAIRNFFSPNSEANIKRRSGFWKKFLPAGSIAFSLPLILYMIYRAVFNDSKNMTGWSVLAVLGCLIIGSGLFNAVRIRYFQCAGHKWTVSLLTFGGTIVIFSDFMMQHPELYDENLLGFYFISLLMMLIPPIFYIFFRDGMETMIARTKHIRKSRLINLTKGMKNYWFYETLHKETNLGFSYYLNKIFIILYVSLFILTLFTGFIKTMTFILCSMHILLSILSAIMIGFARIQENLDYHGTHLVIWANSRNGGVDSIFLDIFIVLFALAPAYIVIMLMQTI